MSDSYAHRRLAELCDDLHPLCPCDLNPATTDGPYVLAYPTERTGVVSSVWSGRPGASGFPIVAVWWSASTDRLFREVHPVRRPIMYISDSSDEDAWLDLPPDAVELIPRPTERTEP